MLGANWNSILDSGIDWKIHENLDVESEIGSLDIKIFLWNFLLLFRDCNTKIVVRDSNVLTFFMFPKKHKIMEKSNQREMLNLKLAMHDEYF